MNKKLTISALISLFFLFLFSSGVFASDLNSSMGMRLINNFQFEDVDFYSTIDVGNRGVYLTEFYGRTGLPIGELTLGRKVLKLGPGYYSQLMLSDSGPAVDVILHSGEYKWFKATQLVAFLGEGVNKQLFAHRIASDRIIPGLEIGVSEAMMASEHIHPAFYLPLPFIPYYLTKKLIGINSIYDEYSDNYVGVDFTYTFKNRARIYGELLVDEFPQKSWSNNPDKRAHLIGLSYPAGNNTLIRAEYSNVFNYVYIHRYPQNNFVYNGELLGHWLGPDGDVFDIGIETGLKDNRSFAAGLRYIRRGIGDLNVDYGEDHEEKKFLSTITERELFLRLKYSVRTYGNMETNIALDIGKVEELNSVQENIIDLRTEFVLSF